MEQPLLGAVSFLINVGEGTSVSDTELNEAQDAIVREFSKSLDRHGISDIVRISSAESRRGCVIVTINIAVAIAVATASPFAAIAFFRHYPQVRRGIIMSIRDLNMARLRIAGLGERLTCVFRTDIPGIDDKQPPPEDIQ